MFAAATDTVVTIYSDIQRTHSIRHRTVPRLHPTTPVSKDIPSLTGYTVDFGMACHALPARCRSRWPPPAFINGGFENGWTGWAHGGELDQAITAVNPYWAAFLSLGNPAYVCLDGVPTGSAWMSRLSRFQIRLVPDCPFGTTFLPKT